MIHGTKVMKTVAGVVTLVGLLLGLVLTAQARTTLFGFVDTSFFYEDVNNTNTFSLDEVELDISSQLTPWAGLRTDINFRAVDSGDNVDVTAGGTTFSAGDNLSTDDILEQGFITLAMPLPFETTFQFGKFNAPIGWELLDPVDMYQYSHALVFNYGIPTNLTGAMLVTRFNPMVDLNLYVVNGWDELNDNNKDKTFGTRLGLTPMGGVNVGLSLITGAEQDNSGHNRTVFDMDFTLELVERLLIGGEFNYGMEKKVPGIGDAKWVGGFVTVHYDFTDVIGGTFRGGIFDDKDGARLPNDNPSVSSQTRYALTFAPTFALAPGVGALVEFRYDKSDEDVFQKDNGNFVDDVFTAAVEFTFSWEETFQLIAKK